MTTPSVPATTTSPATTTPAATTSPTTNAVLVLSTYNAANKPMVIDCDGEFIIANKEIKPSYSGYYNDDLNFEYGAGVSIYSGCGATLMGQFWYFGGDGDVNKRQVNK